MKSFNSSDAFGDRFAGLDILRVLAMVLITAQHGLAAVGRSGWVQFRGVDAGQIGVGIFCAVSGLLAMHDRRAPAGWLWKRLCRLFPPYWLAMLFAFAVTAISGRKTFDFGQFVSQMLGLGYFTHGWFLVNQVTWFISLILLCYALAFLAKLARRPGMVMILIAMITLALVLTGTEVDLSQHILSFSLAAAGMHLMRSFRRLFFAGFACILFLLVLKTRFTAFAAISLLLMALLYTAPWGGMTFFRIVGGGLYEYFLVHGIFFAGAGEFIGNPVLAVICGLAGSVAGAVALRKATELAAIGWRKAASVMKSSP